MTAETTDFVAVTPRRRKAVPAVRPQTPNQLHQWLRRALGIEVPRIPLTPGSDAPFDYLCHSYFDGEQQEDRHQASGTRHQQKQSSNTALPQPGDPTDAQCLMPDALPQDPVVWACRGGGKTFYGAVATVLDLVFKPGIEIKILGGSLEQSQRMHEHLRRLFARPAIASLVKGRITDRRVRLHNGSRAEVLAQSETSVRGSRPQKIRCDEVELFDPKVWEAVQLVTRSKVCGGIPVRGTVEALSTMHRPHGFMARIVEEQARRVFRWGVVDVLERCPPMRPCGSCNLFEECAGRAKSEARGHITIDDALALKSRVGKESWEAEMLCRRPSRSDAVFPEFDRALHVARFDPAPEWRWVAGMDFGFRAPTVILWACVDDAGTVRVIDERIESAVVMDAHINALLSGTGSAGTRWPRPAWVGADPAGNQRNDQTGRSNIALLTRAGLTVRASRTPLEIGLRTLRARLAPASGPPTLFIHERCAALIQALESYHWRDGALSDQPAKDGPDHAIDALRYLVTTLDSPRTSLAGRYW